MLLRVAAFVLLAVVLASHASAAEPDWKALEAETLQHYMDLLSIDTSNPPGNEIAAVNYIRGVLDKEGIPSEVFGLEPKRANLVVRIKGNGTKKPLLFMGHSDVVGVQRERWNSDPFKPIRKDGFVYARGANDDKDSVAAGLMLILLLHRNHVPLDRDVIFLIEAGEEGTPKWGIDYMIESHWDKIACEFALAEGGGGRKRQGKMVAMAITTTEKAPRTTYLVAHGTAGHGSIPRLDNPVAHLSAAVATIASHQPPMHLNDTTRTFFEKMAGLTDPESADRYKNLTNSARTAQIQQYLAENEPANYSMLRTSIVPTIVEAGFRSNVIPSEAKATLDVRVLPNEKPEDIYEYIRKTINDPSIEVQPAKDDHRPMGPPSSLTSEAYRALESVQKELYPGAVTIPMMLTGATDMAQLRAKGVQAYGIGPAEDDEERGIGAAHTDNERLKEQSLYEFVQYLYRVVVKIAGS